MKSIAFYTLPIVLGYLTVIAVNETERFTTDASAGSIHKHNPVSYGMQSGHVTTTGVIALTSTCMACPCGSKTSSEGPLTG